MRKVHGHALSGHGGINSTVEKVSRSLQRSRMRAVAEEYVLTYKARQQSKPCKTTNPRLLQSLLVPERIWTDITTDFIVGMPEVKGCDSFCVVVDMHSNMHVLLRA